MSLPPLIRRVLAPFSRRRRDSEMEREMAFHVDALRNEYRLKGMTDIEAEQAASRRFGSALRFKEQGHDVLRVRLIADAVQDLSHVGRHLRRSPGLTAAILITLALGIGLNTLLFSLFNGLFFRPQVDRDPETFVHIYMEVSGDWQREVAGSRNAATVEEFLAIGSETKTLETVTASRPSTFALDGGAVSALRGAFVSCNFLGAHARPVLLGRGFAAADCDAGAEQPVAVLSERGWTVGFGRDPAIVGRQVRLNNHPFTIVGVTPDDLFGAPLLSLVYVPYTTEPLLLQRDYFGDASRRVAWLTLSGRLNTGATAAHAQSELSVIVTSMDRVHPGRVTSVLVSDGALIHQPGTARRAPIVIGLALGATLLVLLLACANVTTLLLARSMARQHEMAIRISIGAGQSRIVRQLLTETFAVVLVAAVLTVALTYALSRPIAQMLTEFPVGATFRPDARVLGYTFLLVLLTTAIAGLSPARAAAQRRPFPRTETLHGQATLIAAQVSIAVILLVATAFVVRTQWEVLRPPVAYDPARVVVTTMDASRSGYSTSAMELFYEELTARLESLPGVDELALATRPPFQGADRTTITTNQGVPLVASSRAVTPGYFRMTGLRLIRGGLFDGSPRTDDPVIPIVVADRLARALEPGGEVVDRTIQLDGERVARIVGVVNDTSSIRLGEPDEMTFYRPLRPRDLEAVALLTHVDADDSQSSERAIAAVVRDATGGAFVTSEKLSSIIARQGSHYDTAVTVTGASAGLAMLLSFAGIFGLMMFSALQRTREIGVRVALGARRRHVVNLFMSTLWVPLLKGLASGLPLAFLVAVMLQQGGLLGGIGPSDPWPYGAGVVVIVLAAIVSVGVPALMVARSEPLAALRHE